MREHRYKAKSFDGQWVEGYYWQNGCGNHFIRTTIEHGRIMIKDYEIDPETLCEFIGLYDKNKKEVWEHDIIDHWGRHSEIKYDEWNCGCCYNVYGYSTHDDFDPDQDKVIGNIFDNPELLEAK